MSGLRRRSSERGFTMVELVMAVAILGIISTTVGVVGIVMFRSMGETQDRLDETRGPRFASVYWIPDVASAEKVNPGTVCGSAGPLVTLQWTDVVSETITKVSYAITTTSSVPAKRQLVRRLCTNGSSTPSRTTVIAPSVATPGIEITCGNGTTYSACGTEDARKSLKLAVTPKGGGDPYTIDAYREVT